MDSLKKNGLHIEEIYPAADLKKKGQIEQGSLINVWIVLVYICWMKQKSEKWEMKLNRAV